jgi:hypothetical protein
MRFLFFFYHFLPMAQLSLSERTLVHAQLRKFNQIFLVFNFDVYFIILFYLLYMNSS